MQVELIFVGTELLLGDILNTNAQYLSEKLAACGADVLRQSVVGDNEQRLTCAIEEALSRADAVITTGGLGPTEDDITKEAAAKAFGVELVEDESILEKINAYFKKKGVEMPPSNKKQALVPLGAEIIPNSNGTAPGFVLKKGEKTLIILPGPPREMQPMADEAIKRQIAPKTGSVILSKQIRTFGIGESAMAESVAELLQSKNPTVAPYAKSGEALLRITAKGKSKEECLALIEPVEKKIKQTLGDLVYGVDIDNIETAVVALLKEKKLTVATAESITGGLVAKRITDVPGASKVFGFGIVSYSNEAKKRVLSVEKETLEKYYAVSAQTAAQMAEGARKLSVADIAVSVTGIAGPESDESQKEAGTFFIGIASSLGTITTEVNTGQKGSSCREYNRTVAASCCLNEIRKEILKL